MARWLLYSAPNDVSNIHGAKHMFRPAALRSLITGLGIALIATACAPENISAPQSLSIPAARVAPATAASPTPSASGDLLGSVLKLPGTLLQTVATTVSDLLHPVVQRKQALARPLSLTRTIGTAGGTITMEEAGVTITFARGALTSATPITVTADSGTAVSYEFGPHGTQFHAPVTIQQDMSLTTLADNPGAASGIQGGYTAHGLDDLVGGLLARVAELLKATTTIVIGRDGKAHLGTSTFIIKHFSGYILISG
jgi:hypothetical protein